MTSETTQKATVQIALRISPELRERVKLAAELNNRSVNSELTATLEKKYPEKVSAEKLKTLIANSSRLLDALDKIPGDKHDVYSESTAVLRDHLKQAVEATLDDTERQAVYDATETVFDGLAKGIRAKYFKEP